MELYDKISFVVEMAVILSVFISHFHRRNHFIFKAVTSMAVLVCISQLWKLDWGIGYLALRYFLLFFLLFLSLDICYEEKRNAKLFALTSAYSVQTVLYIGYKITAYMIQKVFAESLADILQVLAYMAVFAAGYVLCLRIFPKRMNVNQNINVDNRIMIVLAMCIILVSNIFNMFMIYINIPDYAYVFICEPMRMLPCILLLCIQFNLLNSQSLLMERDMLERLLKEKDIQYQISKENIELIQLKCHDLKYRIQALQRNHENIDKKALQEIEKNINIYDGIIKTGNEVLDVILTEKSLLCEKHRIKITVMLDGSRLNYINSSDLYCVFGNAIDNAIEAAEKQEEEKRIVGITSKLVGNLFSIQIANYYSGDILMENGIPVSSKEDRRFHGFGIKSMRNIVQKYDGDLLINKENHLFVVNILLPLK